MKRVDQLETVEGFGAAAFRDGVSRDDCPYEDRRNDKNRVTFSRAFRNAWFKGWDDAKAAAEARS